MAQPAGFSAQENRSDIRKPAFWVTANLDPPWQFRICLEQFLAVKENINPEVKLEAPEDLLEDSPHDLRQHVRKKMKLR